MSTRSRARSPLIDAATPQPAPVSAADLTALAADLRAVWSTPTTDVRLKKRIVRTVIHEVVTDIDDEASEIVLLIHWIGGAHTELRLPMRQQQPVFTGPTGIALSGGFACKRGAVSWAST